MDALAVCFSITALRGDAMAADDDDEEEDHDSDKDEAG